MEIVYLTGTNNKEELHKISKKEAFKGNLVLKKEKLTEVEEINTTDEEKENIKLLNIEKIKMANKILVINEITENEENIFKNYNKEIVYLKKESIEEEIKHDEKIIKEKNLMITIKDGEIIIPKAVFTKGYGNHLKKKLKLKLPLKII